jgi:hypothetical protein
MTSMRPVVACLQASPAWLIEAHYAPAIAVFVLVALNCGIRWAE